MDAQNVPDIRLKWESQRIDLGDVTDLKVAEGQFVLINQGIPLANDALITVTTELPNMGLGIYAPVRKSPIEVGFGLIVAEFVRESVNVSSKYYLEEISETGELVRRFDTPVYIHVADQTLTARLAFQVRIKRKPLLSWRNLWLVVSRLALAILLALVIFFIWKTLHP